MDENKQALVPKLRFPEYREAEGWKYIPLNRLAIRAKQKNRDQKIDRVLTNSAEFGVVDQRDFFDKDIATQGKLEGYFVAERGTYVYNPRISSTAPVGPISKNKIGTGVMSPLYTVFKFKDDRNDFYEHFFKTTGWHTYMRQASSTGARHDRMAISSDDFMAMPLPVSSQHEQQKIADCLSSLDEMIAAQGRKVSALKIHKKGLMQQLFPRKGETQPRLRFPEFHNADEWESVPLGRLLVRSPDYGVNAPAAPFSDLLPKYLRITDISEDGQYLSEKMVSVDMKPTAVNYLDEGDIVLARTGASVGKSYRYRKEDGRLVFAGFLIRVKPAQDKLLPAYLVNFLTTDVYWGWVAITSTRSGQPGINSTEYSSLPIPLPQGDLSEQRRIADCLTSLDILISAHMQKLEFLKTHKEGLMQQLFPPMEVVEA
ncbi:restriction endonuclease subunit S [Stutzerimonas kunmingensis]|uniref:restriction endonuclease subunit S n=1 Tax=Stutzerimonas kunmingensis TaxID=1211807 RepID=UPI0005B3D753|nr:restriction endonuclease subunit S [Stutzerimonas kunmingensis]